MTRTTWKVYVGGLVVTAWRGDAITLSKRGERAMEFANRELAEGLYRWCDTNGCVAYIYRVTETTEEEHP